MIRKLYVDLSILAPGMGGVTIYAVELARELTARFHCEIVVPSYWSHPFANSVASPPPLHFRKSMIARRPGWRRTAGVHYGADAFVYAPHMRGTLGARHQAITVHDMIHNVYPTRNAVENAYHRHVLPRVVRRAELLLTVSHASQQAIAEAYGIPRERIRVVPNGIDLALWKPRTEGGAAPESDPYLLVVSANRPYKNTLELLHNHALWAGRYRLKVVSSRARYGVAIRAAVAELGLERRVDFQDGLSEQQLIALYQDAAAIVYPSLIEGFGRPALEGMAVGRPVILSDIPPHVEIFGKAGIFATPGNRGSWERAFAALDDTEAAAGRTERGLAIAARHSWPACADQLEAALLACHPEIEALRIGEPREEHRAFSEA